MGFLLCSLTMELNTALLCLEFFCDLFICCLTGDSVCFVFYVFFPIHHQFPHALTMTNLSVSLVVG